MSNNLTSFDIKQRYGLYSYSKLYKTLVPGCGPTEIIWLPCLTHSFQALKIGSCANHSFLNSKYGISNEGFLIVCSYKL